MTHVPSLNDDGIYLALGGGAARGFAHLGILMALEEAGVPISGIAGTSAGALVGACYALSPNAEHVARDFTAYIHSNHFNQVRYSFMKQVQHEDGKRQSLAKRLRQGFLYGLSFTRGSVISFEDLRREIFSLVPNKSFSDLTIPFIANTVDLTETREVVITGGFLRSAVMASAAIPGVFPAIQSGQSVYVDGGWMNRIPVNPLLCFGAKRVVAIDVSDDDPPPEVNPKRGFSILNLANKASRQRLHELQVERANLIWRPPVKDIHWADFVGIERIIQIGVDYAREHMEEIWRLLEPPPKIPWWVRGARKLSRIEPESHAYTFDVRSLWDIKKAEPSFNPT